MRPIPLRLLIHSAELSRVILGDYNVTENSDTVLLEHVRVEPCYSAVSAKDNRQLNASYKLFYDCLNSSPQDVTFDIDMCVTFDGEVFHIEDVRKFYDERKLHHIEVMLCR